MVDFMVTETFFHKIFKTIMKSTTYWKERGIFYWLTL